MHFYKNKNPILLFFLRSSQATDHKIDMLKIVT